MNLKTKKIFGLGVWTSLFSLSALGLVVVGFTSGCADTPHQNVGADARRLMPDEDVLDMPPDYDQLPPIVQILAPGDGATVAQGADLTVRIRARDGEGPIKLIRVSLDVNGDGFLDVTPGVGEVQLASPTANGVDEFDVIFGGVCGAVSDRLLKAVAYDQNGNAAVAEVNVVVKQMSYETQQPKK